MPEKLTKRDMPPDLPPSIESPEMPDLAGFSPIGPAEGPRRYFHVETNAWILGEIIGRFQRKDSRDTVTDARYYYQIRLAKPCPFVMMKEGEGANAKTVQTTAQPGQIVNVDERSQLEDLKALAEDTLHRWEVFLQATEKLRHPRDPRKTIWQFKRVKRVMGKKEI